jgi:hypothetical protein
MHALTSHARVMVLQGELIVREPWGAPVRQVAEHVSASRQELFTKTTPLAVSDSHGSSGLKVRTVSELPDKQIAIF